jgi:hypothetical protein
MWFKTQGYSWRRILNRSVRSPFVLAAIAITMAIPTGAAGQTMQQIIDQLFVFSGGNEPLFLSGSAGSASTQVHGDHFIPAEAASNGAVLDIFSAAIARNLSSFPLSSTVSSQTFRFVGGVPTPSSSSFGPIFSERAQTLGRGRFDVGFSYTSLGFDALRGVPLDDLKLNFLHQNVDFDGCDALGEDCTLFGFPSAENAVINLGLNLQVQAQIHAFNAVVGVADWLDVGVVVPVVRIRIDGQSSAEINTVNILEVQHFFGGTPDAPELTASTTSGGETLGLGDVAVRTKVQLLDDDGLGVAILGEARIPTGRSEDFLGTGDWGGRGVFIASGQFGDFSPHANFGYRFRGGDSANDSFQFAAGFDHLIAPWATFVVDLLGEIEMGDPLAFPEPATIEWPVRRQVSLTNIPNSRDDTVAGAFGFKFRTQSGMVLWTNALIALNDGGMRDKVTTTFGLQYATR